MEAEDGCGEPGGGEGGVEVAGVLAALDEAFQAWGPEVVGVVVGSRDLGRGGVQQEGVYSGGTRRRLDIAAGLITTPDLLFLDEPTTGLDPRSRNRVWELVQRVAAAGTAVLLTTQYLEEADRLAERIAVVDHGRIVAEGTSAELKARVGADTLHLRLLDGEQRPTARRVLAEALAGTVRLAADPLALSMLLATPTGTAGATDVGRRVGYAMTRLADAGVGIADFSLGRPSLDEAFLALTGRTAGPAADHEDACT
ncbi:AAA family ATPase [Embleya sp. NPDC050493]|uniref:AAA family ATPase n=1 Tax=Embleya sp. NPDC050493 TaxID=3363989 RepID=UPI00379903C1